jgi:predicted lipoprotein with Yx(FWY)xxD motif
MLDKSWGAPSLFRCNDRTRGGRHAPLLDTGLAGQCRAARGRGNLRRRCAPPKAADTSKGPALTDATDMTPYIFDKDSGGKSACTGKCAENWPPLMADPTASAPAGYSLVIRDDGKQWAYQSKPLYGWVKDAKPGDATGDGIKGLWHVARP